MMSASDITGNYHGGNENSVEAFEASRSTAKKDRRRIIEMLGILKEKGATCDEAEVALELSHQSCSARFSELKRDKLITPSGKKRKTRAKRNADVMVLLPYASKEVLQAHNAPETRKKTCPTCGQEIP